MPPRFQSLRLKQLNRIIRPLTRLEIPRPQKGWIRAVRQASGLSIRELAGLLRKSPSLVARLEKSEENYRITLESLRQTAEAMNCRLVYAFVPMGSDFALFVEDAVRKKASENVSAVEHSMALEDQAVGRIDEKIEEETTRLLTRRRR